MDIFWNYTIIIIIIIIIITIIIIIIIIIINEITGSCELVFLGKMSATYHLLTESEPRSL